MKKLISGIVLCLAASSAGAADRTVLIEDFNATWCGPCVPIGNIMSNLYNANPETFALVQIHINDAYELSSNWDINRLTQFYQSQYLPTCMFDGREQRIGSGWTQVQLNAIYQARRNTPTDVIVTAHASLHEGSVYAVNADVAVESGGAARTMRVYIAQVLDHYPTGSHYRNCLRQIYVHPTTITLNPGEAQTIETSMTFAPVDMGRTQDIRVVAWAQATGTVWVPGTDNTVVYNADIINYPFVEPSIPGDLDGDGDVDLGDLTVLLANFGTASGATPEQGDITGDGAVSLSDLTELLAHFGETL